MRAFTWQPGVGPDTDALERLREHFPRPAEPMGEAWFMGEERRMFPELCGDITSVSTQGLREALEEIASGLTCFGRHQEWCEWYPYLLPRVVPRAHERNVASLLEGLVTAFMALYPAGIARAPYEQFREDALATLGRCLMSPDGWRSPRGVASSEEPVDDSSRGWSWHFASSDLSASLWFCLKYLPAEAVADWFGSVLAIRSPLWRAHVMAWLVGAHATLEGRVAWPSEWKIGAEPNIQWESFHYLRPDMESLTSEEQKSPSFIPGRSRAQVLESTRRYFTADEFLAWLECTVSVRSFAGEHAWVPLAFERLYVTG